MKCVIFAFASEDLRVISEKILIRYVVSVALTCEIQVDKSEDLSHLNGLLCTSSFPAARISRRKNKSAVSAFGELSTCHSVLARCQVFRLHLLLTNSFERNV